MSVHNAFANPKKFLNPDRGISYNENISIATIVKPNFVDVFAGCGGLSLGLMQAGWTGLFAIEKDAFAFKTLSNNLIGLKAKYSFQWPDWLPKEPICAIDMLANHHDKLIGLAGTVDLLVGGPPCQGYSSAGRRDPNDPRNILFENYLSLVQLLKPKLVLLENVRGITQDFNNANDDKVRINYASKLIDSLSNEYKVSSRMLDLSTFGIPQNRLRFFLIGIRKDYHTPLGLHSDPFEAIEEQRQSFLFQKGITESTSSKAALSDLEIARNGTINSTETLGFRAIDYNGAVTSYQKLMNCNLEHSPTDTRLANHRPEIVDRFRKIIQTCHADGRLNVTLKREMIEIYGLRKQALRVLDPDKPAPTVTSMPDDLLHYNEPRTLTVRENARLQSFPDWFYFCGNYTTGGHLRKCQVPRFTQVANAVPPLVAEAIGLALRVYVNSSCSELSSSPTTSSHCNPTIIANSSKFSR